MSDTKTIPDVDFPYPPCPLCGVMLEHDDGWFCGHCEVSWQENGTGGEHYGRPPCGVKQYADAPPRPGRPPNPPSPVCLLDEGHNGDHSGRAPGGRGWMRWSSATELPLREQVREAQEAIKPTRDVLDRHGRLDTRKLPEGDAS